MKRLFLTFTFSAIGIFSNAQIEGKWKTIDDETGKEKSIVEIYKKSDGKYYGKIIQLLIKPENETCVDCTDDRKNKPLVGLEIIRGLKKDGNEFSGGTIVNPKGGKEYGCKITRNGDKLNVKGSLKSLSFIGKTQTWHAIK